MHPTQTYPDDPPYSVLVGSALQAVPVVALLSCQAICNQRTTLRCYACSSKVLASIRGGPYSTSFALDAEVDTSMISGMHKLSSGLLIYFVTRTWFFHNGVSP